MTFETIINTTIVAAVLFYLINTIDDDFRPR